MSCSNSVNYMNYFVRVINVHLCWRIHFNMHNKTANTYEYLFDLCLLQCVIYVQRQFQSVEMESCLLWI